MFLSAESVSHVTLPLKKSKRKTNKLYRHDEHANSTRSGKSSGSPLSISFPIGCLVMAPRDTSQDPSEAPVPVEKGFATLATLRYVLGTCISTPGISIWDLEDLELMHNGRIGVKAFVEKVEPFLSRSGVEFGVRFASQAEFYK